MNLKQKLIGVRNDLQPKLQQTSDLLLFDYKFWSELESLAKKERESAKKNVLALVDADKKDKPGILLRGGVYHLFQKFSAAPRSFDLQAFINLIIEKYPDVQKHDLVRWSTTDAVTEGTQRRYITTEDNDD